MTHPIIKTDNYLLVVDESEIKKCDFIYHKSHEFSRIKKCEEIVGKSIVVDKGESSCWIDYSKKIIFHLPLNNAPTLERVELLPPLEDEAEKFAESKYPKNTDSFYDGWDESICPKRTLSLLKDTNSTSSALMIACKIGYNKAKEKYKYTEEDLKIAINMARNFPYIKKGEVKFDTPIEKIIQSLQQPKYPVAFECEMITMNKGYTEKSDYPYQQCDIPKTITNSQVVGKYIY